jgi:hypothetical protein
MTSRLVGDTIKGWAARPCSRRWYYSTLMPSAAGMHGSPRAVRLSPFTTLVTLRTHVRCGRQQG